MTILNDHETIPLIEAPEAANGRFFITEPVLDEAPASFSRPSLGELAARSEAARAELNIMNPEDWTRHTNRIGDLIRGSRDPEVVREVARIENLLEEAALYHDTLSLLRRAGNISIRTFD